MFANLRLRSKMILGFSTALIIISVGLIFGIVGLLLNVSAFDDFTHLSNQLEMAKDIENELLESRLAYKHFMTAGDEGGDIEEGQQKPSVRFEIAFSTMIEYTNSLRQYAGGEYENENELRTHLQTIERSLYEYKNNFETIRQLDGEMLNYYNSIASKGYNMLDQLTSIKNNAYGNSDVVVHKYSSEAIQHLLRARLHASKYFDFHTKQEYEDYLSYYEKYERQASLLFNLEDTLVYDASIASVVKDVIPYKDEMAILYDGVTSMDDIESQMDLTGPKITSTIKEVIGLILYEQDMLQANMEDDNTRWVIEMVVIAGLAVFVFILIAYNLLKLVLTPIHSMTKAFEEISEGETDTTFRLPVDGNDEIGGVMSSAFNRFMVKLAAMMEDIRYQNWLKTGQNELFEMARDENEMQHLCEELLAYVVGHVEGLVGRVYLHNEEENHFDSIATYGLDLENKMIVKPMEGIIGNSIITKKMTMMHKIPSDYMSIKTGLGDTTPKQILILPCSYNDEVNCVIEVGHLEPFSATEVVLLEGLSEVIGNIVHSTLLRANMKILLDKTIRQSEELQMQQEELRQSNEELEEQTRALKESEQRLQAQQEELRVSNEELEERSKQLELQKVALDEKNKSIMESQDEILEKAYELEQANRYKSEFLANMSHELRTPLNSILVLSQLLGSRDNNKPLTEKEMEFANTIHTSGSDLLTLINGVLDLSKVEAGRLELLLEEIKVDELIGEYERLFNPVADIKAIEFKTHIAEDVVSVIKTDRLRMSQIVKNLVSNAIKFTHDGHVELSVRKPSIHECDYTGFNQEGYIAIAVSDTGIGIEPDKKDVIFEAFRQEDGTTSRTYGGTGLGLTISLELSKLLGGDIVLESEVGVGSQFVLIIPIGGDVKAIEKVQSTPVSYVKSEVESLSKKDNLQREETSPVQLGSGSDLLIIEDDPTFAGILAGLAEEKGYKAVISDNGIDGIRIAQNLKPAAIILDMGLPDMDGMEVAKKLETNESTSDIPIHIISGKDNVVEEHMPKSIIGFLKKPVGIKTIYKTLAKIENLNHKGLRKLLVVGHCGGESFENFTNLGKVEVVKVETGNVALEAIVQDVYGCIVLDTRLEDMSGMDFISKINERLDYKVPVVIYTEEDINFDEYDHINQYAESVIIKSEKSRERLTDEVSLFLHDMNRTIEQYQGTITKTLKANVKHKIEEENDLTGKRVLLVDDDERNVFALLHALEQYGLDVVIAKDGHSAIERFEEEAHLDIVLMDIMMPKMDGYEAIKQLRAKDNGKHIPIIALTAKAMAEDRERCIKVGANDYMTKPIDTLKLVSLMKVWMA